MSGTGGVLGSHSGLSLTVSSLGILFFNSFSDNSVFKNSVFVCVHSLADISRPLKRGNIQFDCFRELLNFQDMFGLIVTDL